MDGDLGDGGDASDAVGGLAEVEALVGLLDVLDDERAVDDLDVAIAARLQLAVLVGSGPVLRVKN